MQLYTKKRAGLETVNRGSINMVMYTHILTLEDIPQGLPKIDQ